MFPTGVPSPPSRRAALKALTTDLEMLCERLAIALKARFDYWAYVESHTDQVTSAFPPPGPPSLSRARSGRGAGREEWKRAPCGLRFLFCVHPALRHASESLSPGPRTPLAVACSAAVRERGDRDAGRALPVRGAPRDG